MTELITKYAEELSKKITELKAHLDNLSNYNTDFYRKKLNDALNELNAMKLRFTRINSTLGEGELFESIKKVIASLDKLAPSVCPKEDIGSVASVLQADLQELRVLLEDLPVSQRIYAAGAPFDFYLDIKGIIGTAQQEILIVDSWIDDDLLEVYLRKVDPSLKIRILTKAYPEKFLDVGHIFKKQYSNFEARESAAIHDRAIFCDDALGWVMGQSIKDAARNKPTYLIKLHSSSGLRQIYEKIWQNSKKII